MSSAVDIQITNPPNLQKIENYLKNSLYVETIEFSANFNKTLGVERRLRVPFYDPQTNVAQNHSNLFMNERQRMPGFRQGQIYSYPSNRWRKSKRQYLNKLYSCRQIDRPFQSFKKESSEIIAAPGPSEDLNGVVLFEESSLGGTGDNTSDSKDSGQQQQTPQYKDDWFYDEVDTNDIDSLEEPKSPADDEYDYDPRYGNKKRRKRRPGKKAMMQLQGNIPKPTGPGSRGGRGRRKVRESNFSSIRNSSLDQPPSPEPQNEPVSFETALGELLPDDHTDLRGYRKYL